MRYRRTVRAAGVGALVVALSLVGVGCGGDGTDAGSPDSTTVAPGTEPSTPAPVPTVPPAGTVPFIVVPPASMATTGPEGGGCTPASATGLPDGEWFGEVVAVDVAASSLDFDLACLWFGAAADAAATAAGAEEVPVPNDYFIGGRSESARTLRLVPDVTVAVVPAGFSGNQSLAPAGNGPAAAATLVGQWAWLEVVDSWVVAVQQQYLP